MLTSWEIYWITRLESIGISMLIISVVSLFIFIVTFFKYLKHDIDSLYYKFSISVFVISIFIASMIPSTKEMAAIYVLPKIVNNEKIQGIPDKILDLSNKWLDDLIRNQNEKTN